MKFLIFKCTNFIISERQRLGSGLGLQAWRTENCVEFIVFKVSILPLDLPQDTVAAQFEAQAITHSPEFSQNKFEVGMC